MELFDSFPVQCIVAIFCIILTIIILTQCYRNTKNRTILVTHSNIPTKIVSDSTSCANILNELLSMNPLVLGIDCEWVSNQKVSLLQIANSKLIILIRLHKLKSIPGELISIMNNNKILKCGVGIYNDAKKLKSDYNIHTYGCIDINHIFPLIPNHEQLLSTNLCQLQLPIGLNKCSQILLNEHMKYKNKTITTSNWENNKLTPQQISYAADDALVGYKLFIKAMQLSNINHNIDDYMDFCYGFIDIKCSIKSTNKLKNKTKRESKTNSKQKQVINNKYPKVHKTKEFFDNCRILKPDDSFLCYCSLTRLNWYLNKNLAERVDNKTIKLNFQPKETHYLCLNKHYRTIIKNRCFVCGNENQTLYKLAVIPECYRKHIDDEYNNRAFRLHDFFPLCGNCRNKTILCQNTLRDKLCEKYCVPYYRIKERSNNQNAFFKAKCAAAALCKKTNKIPVKRQIELLVQVCGYYGLKYEIVYSENGNSEKYDNLIEIIGDSKNIMEYINQLLDKNENPDKKQFELHSKSLMEIFKDNQRHFMEIWRQYFVDYMKPKCLPEMWTVNASNVIVESNCPACNIDFKSP